MATTTQDAPLATTCPTVLQHRVCWNSTATNQHIAGRKLNCCDTGYLILQASDLLHVYPSAWPVLCLALCPCLSLCLCPCMCLDCACTPVCLMCVYTPRHHLHDKVITAKPSDPLEAFKHEIEIVEAEVAAGAEGEDGNVGDPSSSSPAAAATAAEEGRAATPDELEFEDDDGTMYKWDQQLRKYVPAGDADAGGSAGAAGEQQQQQQRQDGGAGYDIDAMTFVAEEEVLPTLAAARAAEEAAAETAAGKGGSKNKKVRSAGRC